MKKKELKRDFIINYEQSIESYLLFDDVEICKVTTLKDVEHSKMTSDTIRYSHIKNNMSEATYGDYNKEESIKYCLLRTNHIEKILPNKEIKSLEIYIVKKDFLIIYENTGFGLPEYEELRTRILTCEQIFSLINSGNCDNNDFVPIIYDRYSEKYFSYPNKEWLTHYEKFNSSCYMVTDYLYDLEKLYNYLKTNENVIISKGIEKIPYYNIDDESGEYYINFFVKINKNQSRLLNGYNISREIIDLSCFEK